jgi:hypothetical protein
VTIKSGGFSEVFHSNTMTTIETRIHIGQPPAIVAKAFLEPHNAVQWTSNLERVEMVLGRPGEVGATAHLHYAYKGRTNVMAQVVEIAEPDRRYVTQIKDESVVVRVETTLESTPGGTLLSVHWSARSTSWWPRLLLRMIRGAIADRAQMDLQIFKRLVENHGALFPPAGSSDNT